jgi:8-oxo-dGTP diphosphatase
MQGIVHVAVGVIYSRQKFYLTQRHADAHQGGKWEFPGGKVEDGESVAEALHRELKEETGIDIIACIPLLTIDHDYGDKKVCLEVFLVDNFIGEPLALEGQGQRWFELSELKTLDLPAANAAIVERLLTYF